MTDHAVQVRRWIRRGDVKTFSDYRAVCSCGFKSPWEPRRDLAEQWADEHLHGPTVEQVFGVPS